MKSCDSGKDFKTPHEWETPSFAKIKRKKTKRLSPYLIRIWDRDELALVIKYEQFKRNKAALALMWDLDARNHEITLLKIKNIRLKRKGMGKEKFHIKPRQAVDHYC